jgi:predicted nucleic acid-binding protein
VSAVVDASLLVAAVSDAGAAGTWAEGVLQDGNLLAPHLAIVEAINILRRIESRGLLSRLEAGSAVRDLLHIDLALLPFAPFAGRVWELRANLTSYDAWYVAVAEEFHLPLATLDLRLAKSTGPRCRFLLPP